MADKNKQQKNANLELAIAGIVKEHGKGAIMRLKDGQLLYEDIATVPTGSLGLDIALGIGGYPRGRIVEIYGPESSGKTTLTLHAIASVQRQGGTAAFIDAEHALDPNYAKKLGVKTEELLISQPDFGEQALEIADMLVRSGAVDLVVVDSVAALVPKAEIEGVLGVDECRDAAELLDLGDGVEGERRLAARLRAVDLHDAPAGVAADAERDVEADAAAGDDADVRREGLPLLEAHDGALAVLFFDVGDGQVDRAGLVLVFHV